MAINANAGRFFPVVALHLGIATDPRKFNQATLPNDIPQAAGSSSTFGIGGQLGAMIEYIGGVYRLVKVDTSDVATIDGGVAYWKDKANYVVTADSSDAEGAADDVAGGTHVVVASDSAAHYIFVQCGGDQAAVVVAASAVAGDHLTGHASTDNVLTRTAAGTAAPDKQAATALSTRGTTTSDNGASVSNSSKVRWILGNLL
jgi:hypothetical protein